MKISKEVKVGTFMVVSLVLLYLGFNYLKGIDFFSSRNKYYAVYDNVDKLMPSNQVYINGYSVGRVSRIQYQQMKNRVLVEMEIDSDIILGDSTIAYLNGDILGTKFIQLEVGGIRQPLKPKDTLKSMVAKAITDLLAESAGPVANSLQSTLIKLNVILDNLGRNSQKLDSIFNEFQRTPVILNRKMMDVGDDVGELADKYKLLADNLSGAIERLKPALSNLETFSDSLKQLELNKTVKTAEKMLATLNETVSKFGKGDNTLGKLMNEDTLYVNMNNMFLALDSLADHFNQNPKHFMSPLGKSRKKIQRDLEKQRKEEED